MLVSALFLGASALGLAAPVSSTSETFSGADMLEIRGFVGTVEIKEGRTLSVEVMGAPEGGPLEISRSGSSVLVEGDAREVKELYRRGAPYRRNGWGGGDDAIVKFGEFLEGYPVLSITLPKGAAFKLDEAALIIEADVNFGELHLQGMREVYGSIGTSTSAYVGIGGMGEISVGDVKNDLEIAIGGSGDIYAGRSGKASVKIGGSGDVDLGDVDGSLDIRIGGSGDVAAENVKGGVSVKIGGSGDVEVEEVGGGINVAISGSGDFHSESMNGELMVSINGSGDVEIEEGKSSATEIRISGNGDVYFGGVANNPVVKIHGGGDVEIEDYTGNVSVSGDKDDVRIGDLTFEKDR
ncbi:GIN domain-containing protein [Parvularcula marina]|uniref:GIN domain-containing protein n=1 Tax=Parvularcula marina TaxID=2292771 RepID=UPI003515A94C